MPENCCDRCSVPDPFEFLVSPELWHEVTEAKQPIGSDSPIDGGEGYWCLDCFIVAAKQKGIDTFVVQIFAYTHRSQLDS